MLTQIEECTVTFKAKISSVDTSSRKDGANMDWAINDRFKGSMVTTSESTSSNTREYSMSVSVKAKQVSMPEGMRRIFDVLETAIVNKVATSAAGTLP